MNSLTVSLLLILSSALILSTSGLKCYYRTIQPSLQQNQNEELKEYECDKNDKYCVSMGGTFVNPAGQGNLTFQVKSCEGTVHKYLDPITRVIPGGGKLDYNCENADGKNRSFGPITYWYNCCGGDDCNSASFTRLSMLLLVSSMLAFGSFYAALH